MNESGTDIDGITVTNSNSAALHVLDQYIEDGILTISQGQQHKEKYSKLSTYVLETYKREKELLKKAKQLNGELLSEKIRLEKQSIRKNEELAMNINLEKEKEKASKELTDCIDRETILTYEITELQREHAELLGRKETMLHENAKKIEPEVNRFTDDINHLVDESIHYENEIKKEERRKIEMISRCDILKIKNNELDVSNTIEKKKLIKLNGDPERISKQGDVVLNAVKNLEIEIKKITTKLNEIDINLLKQEEKRKEADEIQKELNHKLDIHRDTIDQRQRDVDHVNMLLNDEKKNYSIYFGEKLKFEIELKNINIKINHETEYQLTLQKEFDRIKKKYKKNEILKDNIKNLLPNFKLQINDIKHQINLIQNENKKKLNEKNQIKQDVDILISRIFQMDGNEKNQINQLEKITKNLNEYENELNQWINEENKQKKIISLLSGQRELKARAASIAIDHEKEIQQQLKMKELIIFDYAKKCNETNNRLKEFSALYDIVKNERNKYVNLIQASSQALAEMKEKIKILFNEVEVLRNESIAKDKALTKEKLAHQTAQCSRDSLRFDTNKSHELYRIKQEQVEQQIVQIEKLNSIINITEKEMLKLKKKYELAVETRNSIGIQLIDRNDELCILYEKSNIQKNTLIKGEIAIQEKEQNIKILNIQLLNIKRKIEIKKKYIPNIPIYATKILLLQKELNEQEIITEIMCRDLETPKNKNRWRSLYGDDPDEEQLKSKLIFLETRLNKIKEKLIEKELILEEITNLSEKLRLQASQGRGDTLQLAKKVNTFQYKIKETTRKMMATVSELSMFQATSMKLQQEKHEKQIEYEQSLWNFQNGHPPNIKCEQEWYRRETQRLAIENKKMKKEISNQIIPTSQITKTTAEPRPNAYVPDQLGIPKPYGNAAPFKPSLPGSTMRHIRPPQIRDIEI